jgi:hypothetical protein
MHAHLDLANYFFYKLWGIRDVHENMKTSYCLLNMNRPQQVLFHVVLHG